MFLSSKKVKGHTYWNVLNKKSFAGQSRSFIVEKLGEEASLLAKNPDFLKRKETEIAKLNEDLKAEKASVTEIRNPAKKATARTMHAGAFPIFAAMSDIGLYDALNDSLGEKIGGSKTRKMLWNGKPGDGIHTDIQDQTVQKNIRGKSFHHRKVDKKKVRNSHSDRNSDFFISVWLQNRDDSIRMRSISQGKRRKAFSLEKLAISSLEDRIATVSKRSRRKEFLLLLYFRQKTEPIRMNKRLKKGLKEEIV